MIAFLRFKLKSGMPTWKRLLIVKGLILYRDKFLRTQTPELRHIKTKLTQIAFQDRKKSLGDSTIDEMIGKIDPNEPDIIQDMRRTLRKLHRHHLYRDTFAAQLKAAVDSARIHKPVTAHTFRHSFATHLLSDGVDIKAVQELLGHSDIRATMIYLHVVTGFETRVVRHVCFEHEESRGIADGEGFEPPVEFPLRRFSKPVPSTRLSHPSSVVKSTHRVTTDSEKLPIS